VVVREVFAAFENGTSNEAIIGYIVGVCESLDIYNNEVCAGTASLALVIIDSVFSFDY